MFTPDQILYSLIMAVVVAAIGYWVGKSRDRSNKEEQVLADVVKDVEQLKVSSVSESRVREIIKDAIEPTSTLVREIKDTVHELEKTLNSVQSKIDIEMAYRRGQGQRRKEENIE